MMVSPRFELAALQMRERSAAIVAIAAGLA